MNIEYLVDHLELIPVLAKLHYQQWSYLRPGESLEARTARLESYLGRRQVPTVVVALDGGEVVGSAMLVAEDLDTRPDLSPWLAGVYVVSQHRHRGIATALVSRILEEARALDTATVYLYTPSAERFFAHLGWTLVEHSTFHDAPVAVMAYAVAA